MSKFRRDGRDRADIHNGRYYERVAQRRSRFHRHERVGNRHIKVRGRHHQRYDGQLQVSQSFATHFEGYNSEDARSRSADGHHGFAVAMAVRRVSDQSGQTGVAKHDVTVEIHRAGRQKYA